MWDFLREIYNDIKKLRPPYYLPLLAVIGVGAWRHYAYNVPLRNLPLDNWLWPTVLASAVWVIVYVISIRKRPKSAVVTPEGKRGIYLVRQRKDPDNVRQIELLGLLHDAIDEEPELREHIAVHDLCETVEHGAPNDQAAWLQKAGRRVNAALILWVEETPASKQIYRTVVHSEKEEGVTPRAEKIPGDAAIAGHIKALAFTLLGEPDEAVKQLPSRAEDPTRFAAQLMDVGVMLIELPTGNRTANLGRAIDIFKNLLELYDPEKFPVEWAMTQNILGSALSDLPTGDRELNLQKAINYYQAALTVRTRDDFPDKWAMTQHNLGIAYRNLPAGDREENLGKAIGYYESALCIYTEDAFPLRSSSFGGRVAEATADKRRAGGRGGGNPVGRDFTSRRGGG